MKRQLFLLIGLLLFVAGFVLAILLGRAFPKFIHAKKMTKKVIYSYMVAGFLIFVGILMINS